MTVLIVLTSHNQLGDTGKKTGFWLEEFAAPYYVLRDAGAAITLWHRQRGTGSACQHEKSGRRVRERFRRSLLPRWTWPDVGHAR